MPLGGDTIAAIIQSRNIKNMHLLKFGVVGYLIFLPNYNRVLEISDKLYPQFLLMINGRLLAVGEPGGHVFRVANGGRYSHESYAGRRSRVRVFTAVLLLQLLDTEGRLR